MKTISPLSRYMINRHSRCTNSDTIIKATGFADSKMNQREQLAFTFLNKGQSRGRFAKRTVPGSGEPGCGGCLKLNLIDDEDSDWSDSEVLRTRGRSSCSAHESGEARTLRSRLRSLLCKPSPDQLVPEPGHQVGMPEVMRSDQYYTPVFQYTMKDGKVEKAEVRDELYAFKNGK